MITDDQLRRIMPNLPQPKRAAFLPFLQQAMDEFSINTPLREAAFLAQIAHESGEFRFMEEIWGPTAAQKAYEPPTQKAKNLGNTQAGDGRRYKGRGPIQITGRANYKTYGDMLGIDIVNNPEMAATPEVGFRTAGLYWKRNGCNELADEQKFITITKRINGGTNGLEDRQKFYARAKQVLGVGATRGITSAISEDPNAPATRLFTRGLDAEGEITPNAADRNAEAGEAASAAAEGAGRKQSAAKKSTEKKPAKKAGAKKPAAKSSAKGQAGKASKAVKPASARSAAKGAKSKKASPAARKTSSKKTSGKKTSKASKKATKTSGKRRASKSRS